MKMRRLYAFLAGVVALGVAGVVMGVGLLGSDRFEDVPPGHYADEAIGWAADQGITAGCGNDQFCPDGLVTRAQIVTFLHRYDMDTTTTTATILVRFDWPTVTVGQCYLIENPPGYDAVAGYHAVVEWHFTERLDPQIRTVQVNIDLVEDGRVVAFTTSTSNYSPGVAGASTGVRDTRWWLGPNAVTWDSCRVTVDRVWLR